MATISYDERGRLVVTEHPHPIIGKWWKRRVADDDDPAANLVQAVGYDMNWSEAEGRGVGGIVVQSATFGASGRDWQGETTVTFDPADFEAEYERTTPDATLAAIDAIEATAAAEARRIDVAARHALAIDRRKAELEESR